MLFVVKQLLVSKALSKALSYNCNRFAFKFLPKEGIPLHGCRHLDLLQRSIVHRKATAQPVFKSSDAFCFAQGVTFKPVILTALVSIPKKPCATQHSSITLLAGLGDYAMRRKLCCLAALFVLILCNEVRLIIVRAIKLRCWFTR